MIVAKDEESERGEQGQKQQEYTSDPWLSSPTTCTSGNVGGWWGGEELLEKKKGINTEKGKRVKSSKELVGEIEKGEDGNREKEREFTKT